MIKYLTVFKYMEVIKMKLRDLFKSKKTKERELQEKKTRRYIKKMSEHYEKALTGYEKLTINHIQSFMILKNNLLIFDKYLDEVIKEEQGEESVINKFDSVEKLATRIKLMNSVNIKYIEEILNTDNKDGEN